MFTVKFMVLKDSPSIGEGPQSTTKTTEFIEADNVSITECRADQLYSVSGVKANGELFNFYVADPGRPLPDGFCTKGPGACTFAYEAYVENSTGATTQAIRF